ncbi:MAG TPA: Asd/ArgC dimerization domain-containing protein [Candidatus Dormibacteraeota bacterium]|nr:Asd/ArgC dimerization domain-containing protein [Candidatus Dormibacteraeota bacterium]
MKAPQEAVRIVIAGASSLRGRDLKLCIEESDFPLSDIRLVDEELVAGTLTEAAGLPAVIETLEEDSFDRTRFAFFTGSSAFSAQHGRQAVRSGAAVIDLSGGLWAEPGAKPWIPALDALLPSPVGKRAAGEAQSLYLVPSTPAQVAISISAAFAPVGLDRLALSFFQPVSERGREGVEELEDQVVKLLSFQPIPQRVFDTQVGFNMVSTYGAGSGETLADTRGKIAGEVRSYLAGRIPMPALALYHAPVFYSHTFSAFAEFKSQPALEELAERLQRAGLKVTGVGDEPPTSVNVAGEGRPVVGQPERDPGIENGVWIWGAADNMRVPATTGVAIAEMLLAS